MATAIPPNRAPFTLSEIAEATGGTLKGGAGEAECCGVTIDSRAVQPGCLFVAVQGERTDGHAYLDAAVQAGAAALLVREGAPLPAGAAAVVVPETTRALGRLARAHRRRWGGKVVAITGSAGKTTTKELTAAAMAAAGQRVLKTPGNLNNQFGVPMVLLLLDAEQHDVAVLEVGTSAPGEIAYLGELVEPDVAAVLLAAAAHTQGLGSVAAVAREKASLWDTLVAGGAAVVNADDPQLLALLGQRERAFSFGRAEGSSVQLLDRVTTLAGTQLELRVEGAVQRVRLALFGEPAAVDACCALACVRALLGDRELSRAIEGLPQVRPTPGRLALEEVGGGYWLLDDSYNANPVSTALALQTLVEIAQSSGGRAIAVLGDMRELGPLSRAAHERAGERAVELGVAVLVGHGPEMAHATGAAVRAASGRFAAHPTRVMHLSQLEEVARVACQLVRPGDVVLVKGSRSLQMEHVVERLRQAGGAP